jgi:hypothetical protein
MGLTPQTLAYRGQGTSEGGLGFLAPGCRAYWQACLRTQVAGQQGNHREQSQQGRGVRRCCLQVSAQQGLRLELAQGRRTSNVGYSQRRPLALTKWRWLEGTGSL